MLALDHAVSFAREDFLPGPSNAAALTLIERWPDWPDRIMALIGPEGSGKSHLAAIWAQAAGARVLAAKLLPDIDLPAALATGALVLEDLEFAGLDERALFHLINLAREEGAFVLITSRSPLATFPVAIRDLASRLRALPSVALAAPDDVLLRADRQARRRPAARRRRGAGELSRQPHRALVRGRPCRGRAARRGGDAPAPAGDAGAGGGVVSLTSGQDFAHGWRARRLVAQAVTAAAKASTPMAI